MLIHVVVYLEQIILTYSSQKEYSWRISKQYIAISEFRFILCTFSPKIKNRNKENLIGNKAYVLLSFLKNFLNFPKIPKSSQNFQKFGKFLKDLLIFREFQKRFPIIGAAQI